MQPHNNQLPAHAQTLFDELGCYRSPDLYFQIMSRAFVNEDAGTPGPSRRFVLPPRDDPGFNAAAAEALLEAAREGDTPSAEQATGYYWGEPALRDEVRRILTRAQKSGDDRLEQLARRFLR